MSKREKKPAGKGKQQKTISEQIQEVADEMCFHYCKWPDLVESESGDPDEAQMLLDKHCDKCPLSRL